MTFSKKLRLKLAFKNIQKILGKLKNVEDELEAIGDNMKQLEISAEKAQEREDKLLDKIHTLLERLKVAEARFEYGEMNVSKLNLRYTNHFHNAIMVITIPVETEHWFNFSAIVYIAVRIHVINHTHVMFDYMNQNIGFYP